MSEQEQPIPEIGMLQKIARNPSSTRIEQAIAAGALAIAEAVASATQKKTGGPETPGRDMTTYDHLAAMAYHQRAVIEVDGSALNLLLVVTKDNWGFQGAVHGLPGCTVRASTEADVIEAARAAARRWIDELEHPPAVPPGTRAIELQLS